jgi:hypothetical protein
MNKTDAPHVMRELESVFSMFGYPSTLVFDNGPPFGSADIKKFCEQRNIKLEHSPPYHPQSNGLVERAVETTKSVLKKFVHEHGFSKLQIANDVTRFLMNHRNLPTTTDEIIPSHKMLNYEPRTKLTILKCKTTSEIASCEMEQAHSSITQKIKPKLQFEEGEKVVYLCRVNNKLFHYKATIIKKRSTFTYDVKVNGLTKMAHVNQLKKSILNHCHLPIQTKVLSEPKSKTENKIRNESSPKATPISPETRNKIELEMASPRTPNRPTVSLENLTESVQGRPKRTKRIPERYGTN